MMARAKDITTNFTGGELSPAIALGRFDIAKYNNGARRIENCVVTIQGGAKRRPGSRFVRATKTHGLPSRLIDFVYNRGQAYVLEMGEGYVRFIKNRTHVLAGGAPYEITSPYSSAQLQTLNFVQKADTAFFAHDAVFPQRLQRFADAQWGISSAPFITPAFEEQGHYPSAVLTLGQPFPGLTTFTTSGFSFLKSDVGRHIVYGGGYAEITGYTSSTVVSVKIITPFPATTVPAGQWNIDSSPQDSITPSGKGEIGQTISLSSNYTYTGPAKTITGIGGYPSHVAVNAPSHGYSVGDTVVIGGTTGGLFDGTVVVDSVTPGSFAFLASGFAGKTDSTGTASKLEISTDSEVWRGEDVGKFVEVNGGLVRITAVPSSSIANGVVLRALTAEVPAGANSWTLNSEAWTARNGYPRAVTINRQRLIYAGSIAYPQNIWASEIQSYLNFQFGTDDDQAFRFELDGPRNSPIRHLAPSRQLLVLTEADEMSLKGGQEKPITATNIQKTDESTAGASSVRPIKIGSEVLFVQAAGKKINAAAYRYEIDGFASPDRTVFASHITGPGILQMAHQKEPDSTIYAVRADGQMAVCAYDIDQEVTAWSRWTTQGLFESIATIPTESAEDAYAIVRRTVGGTPQRYVEVFDPEMLVDCGISGADSFGRATWGGLDHLEGEKVQAWADGASMGEFIVSGGQVTLPRAAKSVQIGLGFNCLVELLQPAGAQGQQVHVNEVTLRVLDTSGAVLNGDPIEFRRFGDELLDRPPPIYEGDVRITTLSDDIYLTRQVIEQPYPLPFHLLDVIRKVTSNEG